VTIGSPRWPPPTRLSLAQDPTYNVEYEQ